MAITDYLFEFSESVVANIVFPGEPIPGVILEPADASINIDGLFIMTLYGIILYALCALTKIE